MLYRKGLTKSKKAGRTGRTSRLGNASKAGEGEVKESLRKRRGSADGLAGSLRDTGISRSTKGVRGARGASRLDGLEALTLLEVLQAALVVRRALFLAVRL